MSVAKDLWLELYELRVSELMDAGVPEPQAEAQAERYAERELPERLADRADYARMIAKESK